MAAPVIKGILKSLSTASSSYRAVKGIAKLFGREGLLMPKQPWWKSDMDFAYRFVADHTYEGLPPVYRNGVLWLYTPTTGVWSPLIKDPLETYLLNHYRGRPVGKGGREEIILTDNRITTIAKNIFRVCGPENMTSVEIAPFGTHRGITFSNGFLRISEDGWALEKVSPAQKSTYYIDLPWGPVSKGWFSSVLHKVWGHDPEGEEKKSLFCEFAGMCLLGLAPTMKRALVLFGERGDNGKSTLIETLRRAFGGATTGGFVRAIPPKDFGSATAIASLAWARLNAVPELGVEEFPSPEAVKAVISGDTMAGRYLYHASFDFIPTAGHLFGCNALPTARDPSDAFWKRWMVLECSRIIPKHEMDPKGALPELMDSARLEVLHLAVEGAIRLLQRGKFSPPLSSIKALEIWRRRSDQIAQFLRAEAEPSEKGLPLNELYEAYVSWSHRSGHRRMSQSSFEERLKSASSSLGLSTPSWKLKEIEDLN